MPILRQLLAATALGAATLLACVPAVSPASAQVTFGSLSNFDVINDTGQPCNGFEIELEGLTSSAVVYTFGETPPTLLTPTYGTASPRSCRMPPAPLSSFGTRVRTIAAPRSSPRRPPRRRRPIRSLMGHQCWTFGDPVNYPTSGCEHFGVSLLGNPTKTTYRWLVGTTRRAR